jgi:hypothetical protein
MGTTNPIKLTCPLCVYANADFKYNQTIKIALPFVG